MRRAILAAKLLHGITIPALALFLVMIRVVNSPFGRVLQAIRDGQTGLLAHVTSGYPDFIQENPPSRRSWRRRWRPRSVPLASAMRSSSAGKL